MCKNNSTFAVIVATSMSSAVFNQSESVPVIYQIPESGLGVTGSLANGQLDRDLRSIEPTAMSKKRKADLSSNSPKENNAKASNKVQPKLSDRVGELAAELKDTKRIVDELVERLGRVEMLTNGSGEHVALSTVVGQFNAHTAESIIPGLTGSSTNNPSEESWVQVASKAKGYGKSTNSQQLEMVNNVLFDLSERKRKQNCLIVFGLKSDEATNDLEKVKNMFKYLKLEENLVKSVQRFKITSNVSSTKIEPIRVVLSDAAKKYHILKVAPRLRTSRFKSVFISPDRTLAERQRHKQLLLECKNRNEALKCAGESEYHYIVTRDTFDDVDKIVKWSFNKKTKETITVRPISAGFAGSKVTIINRRSSSKSPGPATSNVTASSVFPAKNPAFPARTRSATPALNSKNNKNNKNNLLNNAESSIHQTLSLIRREELAPVVKQRQRTILHPEQLTPLLT